jgi:small basic protein
VVLLWRLRGIGTELGIAVALACALVIGAHVLAYDMLFLAPLGVVLARRHPWEVFVSGWAVSMALIADYLTRWFKAPVHLVEFVPLAVLAAALLAIRPLPAGRPTGSPLSRMP